MFLAIPFRDDTPLSEQPVVTYGLVAACTIVFLWHSASAPAASSAAHSASA
jgi:membrane associated rhomboid family serine protease